MAIGTPTLLGSLLDAIASGGGNDVTYTVPGGGVASGSVIVLAVTTNAPAATIDSITDTRGNTYTVRQELGFSGGTSVYCAIADAYVSTTLQASDTIVVSFTAFVGCGLAVYTMTGSFDSGTYFEAASEAQMNFATAYDSSAVSVAGAAMLFGINTTNDETSTFTSTGSFTELDDASMTNPSTRLHTQYRSVSAGSYNSTATSLNNADGLAGVTAYKEASAPTNSRHTLLLGVG